MIRLFISLYLFVIIGLFTINWGSEYIWHQYTNQETPEFSTAKRLSKTLSHLIHSEADLKTNVELPIPTSLIGFNDIAWLPEQKEQLSVGNSVMLFDLNEQIFLYVQTSFNKEKLLKLGPIDLPKTDERLKYVLLSLSYLLLAVIIAIWAKPIWRDLNLLSNAIEAINNHQDAELVKSKVRSPISPIINTIRRMASRIKHLIKEQKQLVNAVSHELRTPLSRLRFSVSMLEIETKQAKEIDQDLNEIETLVDEMLSYARIEHLAQNQQKSSVDLSELLLNQIEKHQRTTNIAINANITPYIIKNCNGELIERACQNLIVNAIRYANSMLVVTINSSGDKTDIIVEDDGMGIPEKERSTIFEPFKRLDKSRNKSLGGFGLGLAIVKKAAEWHNGHCYIDDSHLGGAKITLTF